MYYWNKDNFQSLLELANSFESSPDLVLLAEYCKLREQGLRAKAFEALNGFLAATSLWSEVQARENVLVIVRAGARAPDAHQFMAAPLLQKLVYPTLELWLAEVPAAVEPQRWLGLLRRDAVLLQRALKLEPEDVVVRSRLIDMALNHADYATHHLDESVILLPVPEVRQSIAAARSLIKAAPKAEPFAHLAAEADTYEQMVDDWDAFQLERDGSFPEWCTKNNRNYSWGGFKSEVQF